MILFYIKYIKENFIKKSSCSSASGQGRSKYLHFQLSLIPLLPTKFNEFNNLILMGKKKGFKCPLMTKGVVTGWVGHKPGRQTDNTRQKSIIQAIRTKSNYLYIQYVHHVLRQQFSKEYERTLISVLFQSE